MVGTSCPARDYNLSNPISIIPTVREIAHSPLQMDDNAQWTKVNTTLIIGTNPYSYTDRDVMPETKYEYILEAVVSDRNEMLGTTSLNSGNGKPESFDIVRVYPTPADYKISIDIVISEQSNIDISIYDIAGRRLDTIESGQYNDGEHTIIGDVSGLSDGVYIVMMTSEGFTASKRFVITR